MTDSTLCRILTWDSDFFGVRVARVLPTQLDAGEMMQVLEWCNAQGVQLLYLLVDADATPTVRLAEDHRFRFVDIRVLYTYAIQRQPLPPPQPNVRMMQTEDAPRLQQIARESFQDGRFYHDPHLTRDQADAFYETWVVNSFHGYADAVLVAEVDGRAQGMVTCHVDTEARVGHIGLIGIHHSARGQGLGRQLTWASVRYFAERDAQAAHVVTQGRNIPAQRLYQSCGFRTQSVQLWYHRWFAKETAAPHA